MNKPTALDRNFAEELSVFQQYDDEFEVGLHIGQNSTLIKHIVFYAAYKYQTSPLTLFKSFTFDVDEFCKITGYNKKHLLAQHPEPYQLRLLSRKKRNKNQLLETGNQETDELTRYSSVIENALYRLATTPPVIHESYQYVDNDGSIKFYSSVEGVPIIKQLNIAGVKSRNGKVKKSYQMELSEMMCNNFSRIFTPVDYNRVIEFRQKQLDDLYIFLKTLKGKLSVSGKDRTAEYNFSKLCEIAGIYYSQPSKNKSKLIEKISAISNATELNVRLEWSSNKNDNRVRYIPVLIFDETDIVISKVDRINVLYQNFVKALFENLPSPDQLTNSKGSTPFSDETKFDAKLINLLRTYGSDKIVRPELKMTFREAVERAYIKSQSITFGPPTATTAKGRMRIFDALRTVNSVADIEQCLSRNYDRV